MNKNRKIKRGFTTSVAVGMSVMLCAIPVCAAEENGASSGNVYKEETVYVNADADRNTEKRNGFQLAEKCRKFRNIE